MIPLTYIARINWSGELGQKLKRLRGELSRREVEERTKALGEKCSQQYIYRLEDGKPGDESLPLPETISLPMLLVLCKAIDADLSQLIPTMFIDIPSEDIVITQS